MSDKQSTAVSALSQQTTLVLICKRPRLGEGKQRLAQTLGRQTALQLAEALLACALEDLRAWPGPLVVAPARSEDRDWAARLLDDALVMPQSEGNLGQRILQLDQALRQQGYRQLIYIGSDAPVLSRRHYQAVAEQLTSTDMVFSRASDGGVTIMANRQPWPQALAELAWSTEQLDQQLAASCRQQGAELAYIEASYDIDIEDDLRRLVGDLSDDKRPARQALLKLIQGLPQQELCLE